MDGRELTAAPLRWEGVEGASVGLVMPGRAGEMAGTGVRMELFTDRAYD